jgi:hypothetical protein
MFQSNDIARVIPQFYGTPDFVSSLFNMFRSKRCLHGTFFHSEALDPQWHRLKGKKPASLHFNTKAVHQRALKEKRWIEKGLLLGLGFWLRFCLHLRCFMGLHWDATAH